MKAALLILSFLSASVSHGADLESLVFRSINSVRASHNLRTLSFSPELANAARSQCGWMAKVGRMEHMRPLSSSFEEFISCEYHPSNRVVKSGYFKFEDLFRVERNANGTSVYALPAANEKVGEIIAHGRGGPEVYNYRAVVSGWMNSPGHRKEILKRPYMEMGVSVVSPRNGETYWCVVFGYK